METADIVVEVKSRLSVSKRLWDFMAQVVEGAEKQGKSHKVPAVVVHRPGMEYSNALIIFRITDYMKLHYSPPADNDNTTMAGSTKKKGE